MPTKITDVPILDPIDRDGSEYLLTTQTSTGDLFLSQLSGSSGVESVAGKTGVVILEKSDISDFDDSDYATSAQGTLADSALQSGDQISSLNNDSLYITLADIPNYPVLSVNGKFGNVTVTKEDVGLSLVDNTSDLDKPVSIATQSALDNKLESGDNISELNNDSQYITLSQVPENIVTSVNTLVGDVVLDKTSVGLDNVDNTSDLDKPVSIATQSALDNKLESGDNISELNNDAGYVTSADLPSGGLNYIGTWDADQNIPDLSTSSPENGDFYEVSASGNTPLGGVTDWSVKDWAIFSDTLGWDKLDNTSDVTSVNGRKGAIVLDSSDVGLSNVDNTSDLDKPVSNAVQTELNTKLEFGDNVSELLNDSAYLSSITTDSSLTGSGSILSPLSVNFPTSGVLSVTGDGVDNTVPAEPVISFPDLLDMQTIRPLRTVDGEAVDEVGGGDISIGVTGLTGNAVDNTIPNIPEINFPNADQVDDSNSSNKFVDAQLLTKVSGIEANAQVNAVESVAGKTGVVTLDKNDVGLTLVDNTSDLDKPVSTATQTELDNLVVKPSGSSFELDIMRRSNTSGEFDYYTPVGGSVKINNMLQGVTVIQDGNVDIDFSGNTQSFSSTINQFPRNVANQFPSQDPVNNPNTFYPLIFDSTTGRWLENPVNGQVHFWRITARFTRSTTAGNRQMRFILTNPDTGFEQDYAQEIRRVTQEQTITANILTVADSGSIGAGYVLNIDLDNQNQTTGNTTFVGVDVTRLSLEKL